MADLSDSCAEVDDLVAGLHESPLRCVVVVTGAGTGALACLLRVPGASRTLLEATVPYSMAALGDMLGTLPESTASASAAGLLARAAYERAVTLRDGDYPLAGLSCTAAIATDRPRRGSHRAHVAARTGQGRIALGVVMEAGLRDRSGEERVASLMLLRAAALAAGVRARVNLGLTASERLDAFCDPGAGSDPLDLLISGAVSWVHASEGGAVACEPGLRGAILPGSFNPLHRGHTALREAARAALGTEVTFELSIPNVDKPSLTRSEVDARLASLGGQFPVVLTNASRFADKAMLFPGVTFVVGFDTAERAIDPRYHGGPAGLVQALDAVRAAGCRFLVAGRQVDGAFRSLVDLSVPRGFEQLFVELPESAFRSDVSSSVIRAGGGP